jgi:hypothetical protein
MEYKLSQAVENDIVQDGRVWNTLKIEAEDSPKLRKLFADYAGPYSGGQ